jgi:hypothetical protein
MGFLKRKTLEEKAAANAEKEARKAELRAKWDAARAERKRAKFEERAKRLERMKGTLQPDETLEAEFRTAEPLIKKDLLFTSKRLLIAPVHGDDIESIPYRVITSFNTRNLITRDLVLHVQGRRNALELLFDNGADRDRALDVLNRHAV